MTQEIIQVLVAAIPSIIIALVSAGGFWGYVEHRYNEKRKSRGDALKEISKDIKDITTEVHNTSKEVSDLETKVSDMYTSQLQCAVKLEKINDIESKFGDLEVLIDAAQRRSELSLAYARDRLNHLSNKYMEQGFIPKEEIIPYKLLGQAYINSGGNSESATKFKYCIEELPIKSKYTYSNNAETK